MLNVSPIGRNCSQEEREAFNRFDQDAGVRCETAMMLCAPPAMSLQAHEGECCWQLCS